MPPAAAPEDPAGALPVPFGSRLTTGHWVALDVVLALFLAAGSVANITHMHRAGGAGFTDPDVVRYLAVVGACAAIPFRRRRPLAALVAAVTGDAVLLGLGSNIPAHLAAGFAMYSAAVAAPTRRTLTLVGPAVGAPLVAALARGSSNVQTLVFAPAVIVVGWLAAENTRARRSYTAGLAEQAAERERERTRQAAAEERARIARELHDVVAHSMTVVAVRSGVARLVLDSDPAEAAEALGIIETVSRRGLAELRRIVGVLRGPEEHGADAPERAPAPGLGDLPALVDDVALAGVRVELHVEGTAPPLPEGQALSAYRIAQEALTNVVRHAGPTATATLAVRYSPGALEIECVDDGGGRRPAAGEANGGHGIVGMRERAALYGGQLTAGPAGRGFRVLARMPVAEEAR